MDSPTPFPVENLTTTTTREFKHHVVMFPFMAQGHIIPFLELAKLLAKRTGFAITIANTPLNIRSLKPKIDSAGPGLDIRLAELPFSSRQPRSSSSDRKHGLPPLPSFPPSPEASEHLEPHFERLIRRICQEDGGRLPLCIISDMFLGWTLDVGNRLGIPRIQFCTVGLMAPPSITPSALICLTTKPTPTTLFCPTCHTLLCIDLSSPHT
jgi:hypothetical protein